MSGCPPLPARCASVATSSGACSRARCRRPPTVVGGWWCSPAKRASARPGWSTTWPRRRGQVALRSWSAGPHRAAPATRSGLSPRPSCKACDSAMSARSAPCNRGYRCSARSSPPSGQSPPARHLTRRRRVVRPCGSCSASWRSLRACFSCWRTFIGPMRTRWRSSSISATTQPVPRCSAWRRPVSPRRPPPPNWSNGCAPAVPAPTLRSRDSMPGRSRPWSGPARPTPPRK